MRSYLPVKFSSHRPRGSRNMTFFVYHMITWPRNLRATWLCLRWCFALNHQPPKYDGHKSCESIDKIEVGRKLVANLHDKTEYVVHIRNLKQTLNYGLVLKKVHRIIKSNQKAWVKPYIDMNADLRKKNKKWFWKRLFSVNE